MGDSIWDVIQILIREGKLEKRFKKFVKKHKPRKSIFFARKNCTEEVEMTKLYKMFAMSLEDTCSVKSKLVSYTSCI